MGGALCGGTGWIARFPALATRGPTARPLRRAPAPGPASDCATSRLPAARRLPGADRQLSAPSHCSARRPWPTIFHRPWPRTGRSSADVEVDELSATPAIARPQSAVTSPDDVRVTADGGVVDAFAASAIVSRARSALAGRPVHDRESPILASESRIKGLVRPVYKDDGNGSSRDAVMVQPSPAGGVLPIW